MAKKSTVLVTGGAGYIGSHTALALKEAGKEVVILDNLVYGHRERARAALGVPIVVADIADRPTVTQVLKDYSVEAVLHFAAYAYVGESVKDPGKYYRNNVAGTVALLDSMVTAGVRTFVFSSTCATYGTPERVPITEDTPQNPINPYGRSKLMVEQVLRDFETAYGLRSVPLRYFNAAGADPQGRLGELHDPETHLIPLVLDAALGRRAAIEVFGQDYPTPDGTCIRDYIHVCDLASAHVAALDYLMDGGASLPINLGTGQGYTVRQVINTCRAVTARTIPETDVPRRPGDPPELVAAANRARDVLGWTPQYAELEAIVRHAWNFHQKA